MNENTERFCRGCGEPLYDDEFDLCDICKEDMAEYYYSSEDAYEDHIIGEERAMKKERKNY